MSDPDAGRRNITRLTQVETLGKMEYHFVQARLASRQWEERKAKIVDSCDGDSGRIYRESANDLLLRGYMDSFGFHERMARLCADVARTRIVTNPK